MGRWLFWIGATMACAAALVRFSGDGNWRMGGQDRSPSSLASSGARLPDSDPGKPRPLGDDEPAMPAPAVPAPQVEASLAPADDPGAGLFGGLAPQDAPGVEVDMPLPPQRPADLGGPGDAPAGAPVFVRIYKKEGVLELFVRMNGRYTLKKSYPICKWSGEIGPKLKEGDYQSPEGFYVVTERQLNPNSKYHLAFNLGYPNAFDRQLGRTGSAIMVHGNCLSVGCFAMTDRGVEEIYAHVAAALRNGQREVAVHVFPFRMSDAAMRRETGAGLASLVPSRAPAGAQWAGFWRNLKEGHDLFEKTGDPPVAHACNGRYAFGAAGAGCQRIAGW